MTKHKSQGISESIILNVNESRSLVRWIFSKLHLAFVFNFCFKKLEKKKKTRMNSIWIMSVQWSLQRLMCFISWFLCRNREDQRMLGNPRTVSRLEWVPSTYSLDEWTPEQSASVRNRTRWSWTYMNFVVFRVMGWGVHTGPPIAPPQMRIVPQWRNFEGFRALPLLNANTCREGT